MSDAGRIAANLVALVFFLFVSFGILSALGGNRDAAMVMIAFGLIFLWFVIMVVGIMGASKVIVDRLIPPEEMA